MTVKELIDNTINANGLYVILKASSNKAGFIKFDD